MVCKEVKNINNGISKAAVPVLWTGCCKSGFRLGVAAEVTINSWASNTTGSYIGQQLLVDGGCEHGRMHRVCSHILGLSSRGNDVIYHMGMGRLKNSVGVVIC